PAVDLFQLPLDDALSLLARAGLADVRAFIRRPSELSEGQRARLRIALALHRADSLANPDLILDEFAAHLDHETAVSLANLLRNRLRISRTNAVIASNSAHICGHCAPDTHVLLSFDGQHTSIDHFRAHGNGHSAPNFTDRFTISEGAVEHLKSLHHSHYRAPIPPAIVRTLICRSRETDTLAGVLAVNMPTLNASWRTLAWSERYATTDRRRAARRRNNEVRRIARVIVDERFRAQGVAEQLVRAYLANPITPRTEAVAAMGRASNFFARAGMTPHTLAPDPRNARLLDAFHHAALEPWRLATPRAALLRASRNTSREFIDRELRTWARASRADARHANDELESLFRRAARSIAAQPVAFTHTVSHWTPEE
ncbi:MAG: hypothetical protein VYC34_02050, partial [Planctomycetota bacterium]|nr:hypothetical protein [Planctomycetota bacterium]